jgi:hypothetical protein
MPLENVDNRIVYANEVTCYRQNQHPDDSSNGGRLRRFERTPVTSAGAPKADIRLHRNI